MKRLQNNSERGIALIVALFALMLIAAVGLGMMFSSDSELTVNNSYRQNQLAYYAARSGLEEGRDRMRWTSTDITYPNGISDFLPSVSIGQATDATHPNRGVLYIVKDKRFIDPTDTTSPYFDDELCHEVNDTTNIPNSPGTYNIKCPHVAQSLPQLANWSKLIDAVAPTRGNPPVPYIWTRITRKMQESTSPWCVLGYGSCSPQAGADTLKDEVCYDGSREFVLADAKTPIHVPGAVEGVRLPSELAMNMGILFGANGQGNSGHSTTSTTGTTTATSSTTGSTSATTGTTSATTGTTSATTGTTSATTGTTSATTGTTSATTGTTSATTGTTSATTGTTSATTGTTSASTGTTSATTGTTSATTGTTSATTGTTSATTGTTSATTGTTSATTGTTSATTGTTSATTGTTSATTGTTSATTGTTSATTGTTSATTGTTSATTGTTSATTGTTSATSATSTTGATATTTTGTTTAGGNSCTTVYAPPAKPSYYTAPDCVSANGQPVYTLTTLALSPGGAKRMLQYEIAQILIPPVPSALTLAGPNPVTSWPSSNPYKMNGIDNCPTPGHIGMNVPAVGITTDIPAGGTAADASTAATTAADNIAAAVPKPGNYTGVDGCTPDIQNVTKVAPSFNTVSGLNAIVQSVENSATATYNTDMAWTGTDVANSVASSVTVVNGNVTLTGSSHGYGILLVTGTLTMDGHYSWDGLILVIGKGEMIGNGGGSGQVNGAIVVAHIGNSSYTSNPTESNLLDHMGSPTFNMSGGGGNGLQYNSCLAIKDPANVTYKVLAKREITY